MCASCSVIVTITGIVLFYSSTVDESPDKAIKWLIKTDKQGWGSSTVSHPSSSLIRKMTTDQATESNCLLSDFYCQHFLYERPHNFKILAFTTCSAKKSITFKHEKTDKKLISSPTLLFCHFYRQSNIHRSVTITSVHTWLISANIIPLSSLGRSSKFINKQSASMNYLKIYRVCWHSRILPNIVNSTYPFSIHPVRY